MQYGLPTDLDDVRVLLRAVLCSRHADCVIHYGGNEKRHRHPESAARGATARRANK